MHSGALAAEHPSQLSELRPPSLWKPTLGRSRARSLGPGRPKHYYTVVQAMRAAFAGPILADLQHCLAVQLSEDNFR